MSEYILRTKNLSKIYGDEHVLKDVSIDLKPGKIYALTGENGAGKTTLIKLIVGLISKTSGDIELFGYSKDRDLKIERKRIGIMPEHPNAVPNMDAKETLAYHRIIKGITDSETDDVLLKTVGLSNVNQKKTKDFSVSMKQRLGIAIALLGNPKLLILDEPTKGLEPLETIKILKLLKNLCETRKATILISTNNLPELYHIATDFIIIHKGKIENVLTFKELDKVCNVLRDIDKHLYKQIQENTNKVITLDLINKDINSLAANINTLFKKEEYLRNKVLNDEKNFKELILNIFHDLRTPLTIIKGNLQLIDGNNLSSEQNKKLKIARKYSNDLGLLIDNFFQYTYLVSNKDNLYIEKFNLTNFITECIVEFINEFEKKGLCVKYNEPPSVFIYTDKKILRRIINNIFRNCLDHSEGNIVVTLNSSNNIILSVKNPIKDNNQIDINQIFNRFYTADNSRGKTTGLGLSIVKLLVTKLDGDAFASINDNIFEIVLSLPIKKI